MDRKIDSMFPLKRNIAIALIFVVAFSLRFIFAMYIAPATYSYDGGIFHLLAENILAGKGFCYEWGVHLSWRPPLYPFFLASIYSTLGKGIFTVRAIQVIIGSLTCVTVYFIGKRCVDERVGMLAGLITAIHPWLIWYSKAVMTETVFTFLLSISVLWALRWRESLGRRDAIICGVFLGMAALTRPQTILLPLVIIAWLLLSGIHPSRALAKGVVFIILAMVTVILPWTIRNYAVHGRIIPIATEGGACFLRGNNPSISEEALRYGRNPQEIFHFTLQPDEEEYVNSLTEVERDKEYYAMGMRFIMKNPRQFIELLKWKLLIFWGVQREGFPYFIYYILEYCFLALGLAGVIVGLSGRNRGLLFLFFVILCFNILFMFYFPTLRFRVPLLPYIAIFGAVAISSIIARLLNRKKEFQAFPHSEPL